MNQDAIKYEVLADGTISLTTDQVSGPNHMSADKLLATICKLAGGEVKTKKRSRLEAAGTHVHSHEHHHH